MVSPSASAAPSAPPSPAMPSASAAATALSETFAPHRRLTPIADVIVASSAWLTTAKSLMVPALDSVVCSDAAGLRCESASGGASATAPGGLA